MLFWKLHKTPVVLTFICIAVYWLFAYDLTRVEYQKLVILYVSLFGLFVVLMKHKNLNFKFLVGAAVLFRLVFLMAIPNLSQDFYRFIWDGRILVEGLNPYLYTPESFISQLEFPIAQAQELYDGMGKLNASHYTNYPPIKQLCFTIAALFSGHNILGSAIVFRVIIIAADIGTLYFGKKLLDHLKLPVKRIFWFILNPFVIIELTGNLHFEGIMVFFLVWSLYLLYTNRWQWAAVVLACSISVKLMPLMFLPLFWPWFMRKNISSNKSKDSSTALGMTTKNYKISKKNTNIQNADNEDIKDVIARSERRGNLSSKKEQPNYDNIKNKLLKLISFYSIVGVTTLLFFIPFYDSEFINNYSQTVALWFNNFEFNASIYYLARAIGYAFTDYNEIAIIGKILPVLTVLYILYLTFIRGIRKDNGIIVLMLLTITVYLFLSTTVHPWYVITPLVLCVFTNYRFPIVWSLVIILSYLAYIAINKMDKSENLWIIGIEYAFVFAAFIWEVLLKKRLPFFRQP